MQSVVSKIAYTCEAWVLQISVVTSRSRLWQCMSQVKTLRLCTCSQWSPRSRTPVRRGWCRPRLSQLMNEVAHDKCNMYMLYIGASSQCSQQSCTPMIVYEAWVLHISIAKNDEWSGSQWVQEGALLQALHDTQLWYANTSIQLLQLLCKRITLFAIFNQIISKSHTRVMHTYLGISHTQVADAALDLLWKGFNSCGL